MHIASNASFRIVTFASSSFLILTNKPEGPPPPPPPTHPKHTPPQGGGTRPPPKKPTDRETGRKKRNALTVGVNAYVCRRFETSTIYLSQTRKTPNHSTRGKSEGKSKRPGEKRNALVCKLNQIELEGVRCCSPTSDACESRSYSCVTPTPFACKKQGRSWPQALTVRASKRSNRRRNATRCLIRGWCRKHPARIRGTCLRSRGRDGRFVGKTMRSEHVQGSRHQHRLVSATMIRRRFRDDSYRGSSFPCAWMIFASAFRFGRNPPCRSHGHSNFMRLIRLPLVSVTSRLMVGSSSITVLTADFSTWAVPHSHGPAGPAAMTSRSCRRQRCCRA